jgi:hypothetical protein
MILSLVHQQQVISFQTWDMERWQQRSGARSAGQTEAMVEKPF